MAEFDTRRRNHGSDSAAANDSRGVPGTRTSQQGGFDGSPKIPGKQQLPGRPLPSALRSQLERSYAADLGDVQIHEDGIAEQLGVKAVAHGIDLHFARGAYDPSSASGKSMIAHEVAHVVQQGMAKPDAAAKENPQLATNSSLEGEAEHAAKAAMAGKSAHLSRGTTSLSFMGFDSWEHKMLGDLGSGGMAHEMGHGLTLSHGDIVMLMGDYFDARPDGPTRDNLLILARIPSMIPGTQVGTQDEVIAAIQDCQKGGKQGEDPRFAPGGIWAHFSLGPAVVASMKDRFNRLALKNREHFAEPIAGKTDYGPREAASGSYRAFHEQAITAAYEAGKKGADINDAMVLEGCGQHFLTDSFSAGHMRTPRADLQRYWDGLYPDFKANLVDTLGELVGEGLAAEHSVAAPVASSALSIPLSILPGVGMVGRMLGPFGTAAMAHVEMPNLLVKEAIKKTKQSLGAAGPPGLGDLLSSILHDTDNVEGLEVTNDLNWRWKAYGDDHMMDGNPSMGANGRSHFEIIRLSVELGCDDIRTAYELGRQDKDVHPGLFVKVRLGAKAPAISQPHKYAPEQLVPRATEANGVQNWKAASFRELLKLEVRVGKGTTFSEAIENSAKSGTINEEMNGVANTLDETVAGGMHPRRVYQDRVLQPLTDDAIGFLHRILKD